MKYPDKVKIVEVGPRDGLQNETKNITTQNKIELVERLAKAGVRFIEAAAFVSPKWVPKMADSGDVMKQLKRESGVVYSALTPNMKGFNAALAAQVDEVAIFGAASETFSQKNTNCSIEESLKRFETMIHLWEENQLRVRAYISTCWICPYEGNVDPKSVVKVIQELLDLGVHEISLGDTIGKANPVDVEYLLEIILDYWPIEIFALHMLSLIHI